MGKLILPKASPPLTKQTVKSMNRLVRPAYNKQTVRDINLRAASAKTAPQQPVPQRTAPAPRQPQPVPQRTAPAPRQPQPVAQQQNPVQRPKDMTIPPLPNLISKGQKVPLTHRQRALSRIRLCFGWNATDARCDIDVSAFLLTNTKVPGDEWFVFYGQPESPDRSVVLSEDKSGKDRQIITVDLNRMNAQIGRIALVMTMHEALEQHLNFSMMRDPYVRVMDADTNEVVYSYKMEELYESVISMTIGELYRHNGQWKFNPVGNGVNQDLAGQCAIYGVQIG